MKIKVLQQLRSIKTLSKRAKFIAVGVVLALIVSASALALSKPETKQDHANNNYEHSEINTQHVESASTSEAQVQPGTATPQPTANQPSQSSKPTAAQTSTKPQSTFTGDEHKLQQTPYPGVEVIRPLIVSQSVIQVHVGQTSDIITANGSGTSISYMNIDFTESTPSVVDNLSIKYDGPFVPGWSTTQNFRFFALPSATPGTYSVRLTVATETETMNSKNPVFYRTTVTVTILP